MLARNLLTIGFYLVNTAAGTTVQAGPASGFRLRMTRADGSLVELPTFPSGEVTVDPAAFADRKRLVIEINARGRYALQARQSFAFATESRHDLAWLQAASDQYFAVQTRLFASRLFRTFIGDRGPNCVGFVFGQPATVRVTSQDGVTTYWTSDAGPTVTMWWADVVAAPRDAIVETSHPPLRVAACLLSKQT